MAQVIYSSRALDDLERIAAFVKATEPDQLLEVMSGIRGALSILATSPLIGRGRERGLRELIISRGRAGYGALYAYSLRDDIVWVVAVRHQRERGYRED